MKMALLVALGCAVALLVILLVVQLWTMRSGRRRMRLALAASRSDVDLLRTRLEAMSEEMASARIVAAAPAVPQTEYLITSAGDAHGTGDDAAISNRAVLSVTFGEPLVKVVAFGYGVRRALSPENRNRIAFEMRREVKRARKERKRDTKRAAREAASTPDHREAAA